MPGLAGELSASNGSAIGLFTLNYWSILSFADQWTLGPGSPSSCLSKLGAQLQPTPIRLPSGGFTAQVFLLPSGSTIDSGIPQFVAIQGHSSVGFDANLPPGSTTGQGTCTGPGVGIDYGVNQVPVQVPSSTAGGSPILASVPDMASYNYTLPAGGNWIAAPSPSAGLSFGYSSCP